MEHVTSALEDALSGNPRQVPLTVTEIAVMEYVIQGYDNHQIAAVLGNRSGTVMYHLRVIRAKLKVRGQNRSALIATYLATRKT